MLTLPDGTAWKTLYLDHTMRLQHDYSLNRKVVTISQSYVLKELYLWLALHKTEILLWVLR
jgi:hypothetical protein